MKAARRTDGRKLEPHQVLTTREDVQRYIDYRFEQYDASARLRFGPFSTLRWLLAGLRDGVQTLIGAPVVIYRTIKDRNAEG